MRTFDFGGRPVPFEEEDTFASALIRAGILTLRDSLSGAPRSLYCGIGVCFECEVRVDGSPVRSCIAPAREAVVETGRAWREAQ